MMRRLGLALVLCLWVGIFSVKAWGADKEEAVKLVQSAIEFNKKNGLEKTITELSNTSGQFRKGGLYVFAYDTDGIMVAHPDSNLMGQNLLNVPDAHGKKFRKEIVDTAKKDGKGWTDYAYLNKQTNQIENKSTYFEKSDDMIFCCGVYK